MGLALVQEREINGVYREDFEFGLLQIGNIARIAEQRLTLKAENSISECYRKQKQEIEEMIKKLESIKSYK